MIPEDPVILLSYINTQLRDNYPSLAELCRGLDISEEELLSRLEAAGFGYDEENNSFK